MKNLLKIIPTFLLSILIIPTVNAQEEASVTVAATVLDDISIIVENNVSFGNIQSSSSPIIDPQGTSTSDVAESATLGKIHVTASKDIDLVISWDKASTDLGDDGDKTMTFTADVASHTSDDPVSSIDRVSGDTITTSTGDLYIYVGGNLGTLTSQPAGTYTSGASNGGGDITFTVNYN